MSLATIWFAVWSTGSLVISKTSCLVTGGSVGNWCRIYRYWPWFEVETEMTIRVLDYGYTIQGSDSTLLTERPEGSFSKLNTFRDGFQCCIRSPVSLDPTADLVFGVLALFFG